MTKHPPRPRFHLQVETLEDRLVPAGDMVLEWNQIMLDAVRTAGTPPTGVSRIAAITQVAVYDSVNALARTHEAFLVDTIAHPLASREAAVATAAHRALIAIYPNQADMLNDRLTASLATIADGKSEDDGGALGRFVADSVLALRQNDGSGVVPPPSLGSTELGQWRPTPRPNPAIPGAELPGLPGLHPHWGDVTPFAMTSTEQFRPDAPPALDSAEYTANFNEVKELGSFNSATRTADQTVIAQFWANGAGTPTTVGHLNLLAQIVAQQHGNSLEENARLFAGLNAAMADAVISCWDAKYEFDFWRPITGIREAATDGNPDTTADTNWKPLLVTPPFPSYTSGHSSISGAATAVLADFFGTDDISFTLPSQAPGFAARSYTSLSQLAEESAASRLYGGIHWTFDNNVALEAGIAIGQYVAANFLRPVDRQAAAGIVNGELIVVGTESGDVLNVHRTGNTLVVLANGERLGEFAASVESIVVDGRGGNDVILLAPRVDTNSELHGGAGNDVIVGGRGDDRIFGGDGRDLLHGLHGDDHLDGGADSDFLFGGLGDDELEGGLGNDFLFGGPGLDDLDGGPGLNRLFR